MNEAMLTRRTLLQAIPLARAAFGSGAGVHTDSDGMLIIDGKRRFILGLYQLPKAADGWQEAARAGFDVVHVEATREQLDTAQRYGMRGWVSVGSAAPPNRERDEARIRNIATNLKDHPALLYWETEDEPAYQWKKPGPRITPEQIAATQGLLKSIDAAHPIYLNHAPANLVSTLQRYNAGADIIATDIYPVIPPGIREEYALWPDGEQGDLLNRSLSQVGQYARKMREVAGPSRAVFLVLQGFAWENLRDGQRDASMVLYPDRRQLRFMSYDAIVQGANGLLFWGLSFTPEDAPLWPDLKAIATELHEASAELAAPLAAARIAIEYHDTGHSLDRGIEWIAKPSKRGLLLLTVNEDRNPVDATFSTPEGWRTCEVRFESRALNVDRGRFRDSYRPFDVHVYELTK